MRKIINLLAIIGVLLGSWFVMPASLQTTIANNAADMANHIVMVADSSTGRTVTNLFTFNRGAAVPFAVNSSSLKVTNLDADKLDGSDSVTYKTATVTTTSTGAQNNFDPSSTIAAGYQHVIIYCNNASQLTISGFAAGVFDGQIVTLVVQNAQVNTQHQNAGSTASGRVINVATTAETPMSTDGHMKYVYDTTTARWRLVSHEQGAWIVYTPVWANTGTANTQGNAVMSGRYRLSGRLMTFTIIFTFGSTSASGSLVFTFTLPGTATTAGQVAGTASVVDASAGGAYAGVITLTTTTVFSIYNTNAISTGIGNTVPMVWASGDSVQASGTYEVP